MKKGISLIVLIITIVIILILTAAVIMSFTTNNPIDSANDAVVASNYEVITDKINMWLATQMADQKASYSILRYATDDDKLLDDELTVGTSIVVTVEYTNTDAATDIVAIRTSGSSDDSQGLDSTDTVEASFEELGLDNYATIKFVNGVCVGYTTK